MGLGGLPAASGFRGRKLDLQSRLPAEVGAVVALLTWFSMKKGETSRLFYHLTHMPSGLRQSPTEERDGGSKAAAAAVC